MERSRPARRSAEAGRADRQPARPEVADDAGVDELAADVVQQLRSLPTAVAARVAGHLAMAGRLLEDDPDTAYAHCLAARALAARLPTVREATGVTAYRSGRFAEALRDLRAVRRMTGSAAFLPMIADCERGLGRPERALALSDDPETSRLDPAGSAELRIVLAGARRDMGQLEAALMMLRAEIDRSPDRLEEWTPRVWYAYADALLAAGDLDQAREWFSAVASVDDEGLTDAEERLTALGAAEDGTVGRG